MARNEPYECGVCNEEYDEGSRRPRILDCSHNLCSHCLHRLIKNNTKTCPFCRKEFEAQSAADVRVNHGILDLVKHLSQLGPIARQRGQEEEAEKEEEETGSYKTISDFKQASLDTSERYLADCQNLQEQIETILRETRKMLETNWGENAQLNMQVQQKIDEVVRGFYPRGNELNQIASRLKGNLNELKEKYTSLQNVREDFDASYTLRDAASAVLKGEEVNDSISSWIKPVQEAGKRDEEMLLRHRKVLASTKEKLDVIMEILDFKEDDESTKALPKLTSFALLKNLSGHVTAEALTAMEEPLKRLIKRQQLFAVLEHQDGKLYAKISLSNKKLHLHYFDKGVHNAGHNYIKYHEIQNKELHSPELAFIELRDSSESLGRVYIRLRQETQRSRSFSLLCTGEMGPSFVNTESLDVWLKGSEFESIASKGYQLDNNCNCKSSVSQHLLQLQDLEQPWVAGTLEGVCSPGCKSNLASKFVIRVRDSPGSVCPFAFGKVVKGLDTVQKAASLHSKLNPLFVKDCGIVLSTYNDE